MVRYKLAQVAIAALVIASFPPVAARQMVDPLADGFRNPPNEARPRVWWHWMNGNVTEDGIAKDIDWMARIGIGGLQNFDADFATPQVVEKRLVYMSPEWRKAFRFAAQRAEAKGLELAIAGSPGWSETGGPWVPPEDGIKKLSWAETLVTGGRPFDGRLNAPPHVSGPYQGLPKEGTLSAGAKGDAGPHLYRDVAILAYPVAPSHGEPAVEARNGGGQDLDAALLSDGDLLEAIDLGAGTSAAAPSLTLRYPVPRTIRSATLHMRDAIPRFFDPRFSPVLEAKVAGTWRPVAQFSLSFVPTTIAFRPVRAAEFRVVFNAYSGPRRPQQMAAAPGAVVPPFIAPDKGPMPARVAEFTLSDAVRVDHAEAKAGFTIVHDYGALTSSADSSERGIDRAQIVDLTGRLRPDGTLAWTPPKGRWRVIRMGWTLTGQTNHPASAEATGLEVDKLDGKAVERYLRTYLSMYRDAVGDSLFGARGVRALLLDSTEVGAFNWTPAMIAQFRRLRGYDPTPWLPALTGIVIGTRAQSDRFLHDFRQTIAELHATEHYATIARVAHEHGLTLYGEALEDQRPVFGDDMAMRRYADIPMAALWTWRDEFGPRPTLLGDMKGASSVGHLYGKRVIAAESMTSAMSPWANAPADLRRVVDLEFAHGINRPVIHTSVHQPLEDKKPGLSLLVFGQFFNRHESWAEMAKPWIEYISRASFLLQQGRNVADVAYFHGEDAPITALTAYRAPSDIPTRYAYDYVNAEALNGLLRVESGDLRAPSGARYRVLYLGPGSRRMTLPVLRRVAALVRDGATVVGEAPTGSPSLADAPGPYAALVRQLWSGRPVTRFGKGKLIAGRDVEAALARVGVTPDVDTGTKHDDLMFVHRTLEDGELYFLVNRSARTLKFDARFRVSGKAPEIWHADSGRSEPASFVQQGKVTLVPLELGPEESRFILFRKDTREQSRTVARPELVPASELAGEWTVSFQPGRGAPGQIALPGLGTLSDHADPRVRYFSGEATYRRRLTLPETHPAGTPLWLDLGAVGDLAEVRVNGVSAGSLWHAPWRLDIGSLVRPGVNQLEVKVANLWVNRLIGDLQPGATKVTFTTIPTYRPDAPLRPSGLIGPVRLLRERN